MVPFRRRHRRPGRFIPLPILACLALAPLSAAAETAWPFTAIGRVERAGTSGTCTGTLVGPRHVLTAAHCLIHPRTRIPLPPHQLTFTLAKDGNAPGFAATGIAVTLGDAYRPGSGPSLQMLPRDWGLLVLDRGPEVRPVPLLAKTLAQLTGMVGQAELTVPLLTGSPTPAGPRQVTCALRNIGIDPALLQHDCAIGPGDSGAPLLVGRGEDAALLAMHVAIISVNGYPLNIALSASSLQDGVDRVVDDPAFRPDE